MFEPFKRTGEKRIDYAELKEAAALMVMDEPNVVANLANLAALLNWFLQEINWVGFYLFEKESNGLVLGPFQGLPACIRIPYGKGVCGTAASENRILNVPDVHAFPGHIPCDSASRSEIVLPLFNQRVLGVLDIDSPKYKRFDDQDEQGLRSVAEIATACLSGR